MQVLILLLALVATGQVVNVGGGSVEQPTVIKGVGQVSIYMACGAYVSNFGKCLSNCEGYIFALSLGSNPSVAVGGRPAVVNITRYVVDDYYRPNLYVIRFKSDVPGSVEVSGIYDVEAYLLISYGVGGLTIYEIHVLPYLAGRGVTKPYSFKLSKAANFTACTVGKYASKVATELGAASLRTGYYHSVAWGFGQTLNFTWAYVPESAVKLAYVVATSKVVYRAYVVGADGRPVPAFILSLLVSNGGVEGDGVVAFTTSAYLRLGDKTVRLEPNRTYTVPGRWCKVTGYTTQGTPLDIRVLYGNAAVASGRGQVETYCVEGLYRVEYRFESRDPSVKYRTSGTAQGNVTLETIPVRVEILGVLQQPVRIINVELPPGATAVAVHEGKQYNFTAAGPVVYIRLFPIASPLGLGAAAAQAAALLLSLFKRRLGELGRRAPATLMVLAATLLVLDVFLAYSTGANISTATALAALGIPISYLLANTPWRAWMWAAASAALAAGYGYVAWLLAPAMSASTMLATALVTALAFVFALSRSRQWICGKCYAAFEDLTPFELAEMAAAGMLKDVDSALAEDVAELEDLLNKMKLEKDVGAKVEHLKSLAAKTREIMLERCGYQSQRPICLYVTGVVTGGQYAVLEKLATLGTTKEQFVEVCTKFFKAFNLDEYEGICRTE
ncbi:MAG: hypothetical protein QXI07_05865 [Pyrobaculum sp.]